LFADSVKRRCVEPPIALSLDQAQGITHRSGQMIANDLLDTLVG